MKISIETGIFIPPKTKDVMQVNSKKTLFLTKSAMNAIKPLPFTSMDEKIISKLLNSLRQNLLEKSKKIDVFILSTLSLIDRRKASSAIAAARNGLITSYVPDHLDFDHITRDEVIEIVADGLNV